MSRQHAITLVVNLVEHEVQQIETRDESGREIDVAGDGPVEVVLGSDWIRGGENRCSCVQSRDDTSFRDRYGLLFLSIDADCEPEEIG